MGYVCFHNSRELARRGHEVTVFTLEHGRSSYETDPKDFRIVRLKTHLIYGDGGMVPQLFTLLKGFDVIHLHYPFFGGAEYVYLASLLRRQKCFLTYHMDVYGNTHLKRCFLAAYEPLLTKRIITRAELVGAVSTAHLKSSKIAGVVDWNRVVELPNGVDADRFRPCGKDPLLVQKFGLNDKTVVLFVGNLQPFKGLHILIEAVSKISDKKVVLLVVGSGYAEEEYRRLTLEKGMQDRVIFAGAQSHEGSLPSYYNLCDFLVLPSTHSESFGLVVLEAMASGKPVIVSALPGPARLVREGKTGLIAKIGDPEDLRDKIEYLSNEPSLRREMGAAAREEVVAIYSWETIGGRLESEFLNMIGP